MSLSSSSPPQPEANTQTNTQCPEQAPQAADVEEVDDVPPSDHVNEVEVAGSPSRDVLLCSPKGLVPEVEHIESIQEDEHTHWHFEWDCIFLEKKILTDHDRTF